MSLRWKITLTLAVVSGVMAAALGIVTYRSTDERLLTEIDRSIEQAGELMVANSGRLGRQREVLDVYSIRRVTRNGEITATTFDIATPVPVDREAVARVAGRPGNTEQQTVTLGDGERFRVHTAGLGIGAVQVARSLAETDAVLTDLRRRSIFLVALATALAALVGWLIAGRVAAPLRRLAASADEVRSTGRLDVALPGSPRRSRDEVGQLRSAFSSMLDALGRSRADQERLVQDAGHELRTPLTSLRTNLAVLRRHDHMPDEMRRHIVDDLDTEVSELTDLVNELVTVASGELKDQPAERLDLAALATAVAARVARRRDRQVDVEAVSTATVVAPAAGVERAISNLIENACKFDTSAEPIIVTVGPDRVDDSMIAVRVLDRGPGVPASEREVVFDRFHRSEATRSLPGSGLGLSMVRDVVTSHGGAVSVRDRSEGSGADIGFSLPAID